MSVLTYFMIAAVLLLFVDIFLLISVKKSGNFLPASAQKASFNKGFIYLSCLFLFSGYMFFFSDRSMRFECLKETRICTYSHSTEYDRTMRPIKTYDFSSVTHAKVTKHYRSKGGSYYTVDLIGRKGVIFKIPHDFLSNPEARDEARKFNRFLSSAQNQKVYIYMTLPAGISPATALLVLSLVLTFFILSSQILSFLKIIQNGFDNIAPEPVDMDEEIRADLKEEGMSDEEIETFLKELNKDDDNFSKTVQVAQSNKNTDNFIKTAHIKNDDVIQRSRKI